MALIDNLKWRYATKKMNGETVPQEKLDYILEAARLAPSSSGLQPYRIFVITNKKLLKHISEIAYNQSQVADCSHLLVFAAWDDYTYEKLDEVFQRTARERDIPANSMDAYKQQLLSLFESKDREWRSSHSAKQAYIAFGLAIAAAAERKVDATPMEGFDTNEMDKLLGLEELGLKSVVLLPLGYRDENADWLLKLKKVRTPKEEFVHYLR
jgi:nitroreductase/dihydropteridine reductase